MITYIFYLLLADAVIANLLAFGGKQHWWRHLSPFLATHFPLARGWTAYYLVLVLLIGYCLFT
ncbi:hypothetical protein H6783_03700 [Candidatus Nomurabacteria bacterium]|nr:hypothetical protein [Candidatus Nomurabacteria bacterium]